MRNRSIWSAAAVLSAVGFAVLQFGTFAAHLDSTGAGLTVGQAHMICTSIFGVIAEGGNGHMAARCTEVSVLYYVMWLLLLVAVACAARAVWLFRRRPPQAVTLRRGIIAALAGLAVAAGAVGAGVALDRQPSPVAGHRQAATAHHKLAVQQRKPTVAEQPNARTAVPADPRPILARTGATEYVDGTDVQNNGLGNRFIDAGFPCNTEAACTICTGTIADYGPGCAGEMVTVYTFDNADDQQIDLTSNANPTDGSKVITLHLANVWVQPVTDANGNYYFPVPVQTIAQRLGVAVPTGTDGQSNPCNGPNASDFGVCTPGGGTNGAASAGL